LEALEDDFTAASSSPEKPSRRRKNGREEAFYLPSEEDESADYEDEGDDEDEEDWFGRRFSSASIGHRRSSYGIAALMENEDDYNADVIRLYACSLAPLLETYKFAIKAAVEQLLQPARDGSLTRTQWKTENELVQRLMAIAREMGRASSCQYTEFANAEAVRNAVRWLISKGIVLSSHDRLRLNDCYIDDRETLERFCAEIENLCVVVTY